jgi:cobalt-zinc-cadmium efflux system protein
MDSQNKKLGISILLNLLITIAQVIGGLLSGSLALLSDALHNFSDVISLVASYIACMLARLPFSDNKTFGWKRAEIIAALFNSVILIAFAVNLIIAGIARLIEGQMHIVNTTYVIVLAVLSILLNGFSVLLLKKDSEYNMNIKSSYLHLLSDMFTSVAVLAGGIAMHFFDIYWVDSALSILISVYLIYISLKLLLNVLKVIMHFTPSEIDLQSIKNDVCTFPEIDNIHHIHIWRLIDNEIHFKAHIDFKKDIYLSKASEITEQVSKMLKDNYKLTHVMIQPEYGVDDDKNAIIDER